MIACLVAFLITHPPGVAMQKRAEKQLVDAMEYYTEHPCLELSAEGRKLFFGVSGNGEEEIPREFALLEDFIDAPRIARRIGGGAASP